jgi:hypothetical protein
VLVVRISYRRHLKFDYSNIFWLLAAALFVLAEPASAQGVSAPPSSARKWEITDNSFLVEEAFNQEAGVVQNIFTWTRAHEGAWEAGFTQEWPAPGMTHQLSYTVAYASAPTTAGASVRGFGDTLLNYRYQLRKEDAAGPAISPRLSLILPTGRERDGLGAGTAGLQFNLPASKQFGDFYVHANAGYTWLPDVQRTTQVAASGIWRAAPMFNLMLEGVVELGEAVTVSPGFRRGWNVGDRQIVVGLAAPVTWTDGRSAGALLTYFSLELPFR